MDCPCSIRRVVLYPRVGVVHTDELSATENKEDSDNEEDCTVGTPHISFFVDSGG